MYGSYDDMMDWKYREENPGYEREIGLTAGDLEDCDPDIARKVAEIYSRDNGKRVENNLRAENDRLRQLLKENEIEVSFED
jgi:hypothetical protein